MPGRIDGIYVNPEKKPLSKLSFLVTGEDGLSYRVPALDKRFAPCGEFTKYDGLVMSGARIKNGIQLEEWLHNAKLFLKDMQFLLTCQHHEFWSYMVHQKSAHQAVLSFVQRVVPFYIFKCDSSGVKTEIFAMYQDILNSVMRIIDRLITNEESEEAWITNTHHRELIHENYLISVPMLFDLSLALGNSIPVNRSFLCDLFETVLKMEPKYKQDLQEALEFFPTTFSSILTQTENEGFEGAGGGSIDANADTPYDDVALYTLDCAFSLSVIFDVCPLACSISGHIKLAQSIASFYDVTIPLLFKNIILISENATSLRYLNEARIQYLSAFNSIVAMYVKDAKNQPEQSSKLAEKLVALLTECLSEHNFVVDYQRAYPIEKDMKIFQELCKDLDTFKASFVMNGYQKEAEISASTTIENVQLISAQESNPSVDLNATFSSVAIENGKIESTTSPILHDDLAVNRVLDVFPHLDVSFIRRLISRYENSEDVIAAILEDNLPPDLQQADQAETYIPPDPQDKMYESTGIKHFNVHDGDPYDVMTQDEPSCIIKRGKGFPSAIQNATELLDDKGHLNEVRQRYQQYSLVSEFDPDDDEYDDSYDALLESERHAHIPKELKAALANLVDISESESDEEVVEESDTNKNFCEDPSVVRARYEARRQAKFANKGGDNGGEKKSHDVVGAPKGQGQTKDTQRNRNYKESNKSSRANHNRKSGAAFKRSKGMLP